MSKIILKQPGGPYKCEIDTEVMEVEIRNAFIGVSFITDSGEKLSVSMRDNGFEVHYSGDFGEQGFNAGWTDFKEGKISQSRV